MQYDAELIEIQTIRDCICRNPERNPTCRSRDAHRMRICPITKEQHFSLSHFAVSRRQTAKFHGAHLLFPLGSVSFLWNVTHVKFDSHSQIKKLFNTALIHRDLCATDRMF
jgi:hypothetical protein